MAASLNFAKCKCPYCGHTTMVELNERDRFRPFVVLCDIDEGPGCGEYYVVKAKLTVTTESFPIKFETEERGD